MKLSFGEKILEKISPCFGYKSSFFKFFVSFQKAKNSVRFFFGILICCVFWTLRGDASKLDFHHCCRLLKRISSQSHHCRKRQMQKAQTEFNVFFNTPQSNTGPDNANANWVNAKVFLSFKKQQAFRPLIAYQKSRNDKKIR